MSWFRWYVLVTYDARLYLDQDLVRRRDLEADTVWVRLEGGRVRVWNQTETAREVTVELLVEAPCLPPTWSDVLRRYQPVALPIRPTLLAGPKPLVWDPANWTTL